MRDLGLLLAVLLAFGIVRLCLWWFEREFKHKNTDGSTRQSDENE